MANTFKKLEDDILEKEIRHDEEVINRKRNDENVHEMDEAHFDKSKMMKDLREHEIHHDERVIEKKMEKAEEHEEKVRVNEQKINDKD